VGLAASAGLGSGGPAVRIGITLTFEVADASEVPVIIEHIDPPGVPFFDGEARITVEPHLSAMLAWLDE